MEHESSYHIQKFWPLVANLIHKSLAYNLTPQLLEGLSVFPVYAKSGIIYSGQ